MRILGIDFGDKNVGLALSDPLFLTAQPLANYQLGSEEANRKYFLNLVEKYDVGEIVIGLPLRMNGSEGTRAAKTREFAAWLEKNLRLPVFLWDERLTTREALSLLQNHKKGVRAKKEWEHQISATIILHGFLERRQTSGHAPQDH